VNDPQVSHYAIFDPEDPSARPRNLFLVVRRPGVLVMAIYDHAAQRWVEHGDLIDYLDGAKADRCLPVDVATAHRIARGFGTELPGAADLLALPPSS